MDLEQLVALPVPQGGTNCFRFRDLRRQRRRRVHASKRLQKTAFVNDRSRDVKSFLASVLVRGEHHRERIIECNRQGRL